MSRSLAALLCLGLAIPATAHADAVAPPSATPVSPPALPALRPALYVQREPKSPAVATALSLGVTAGGAALLVAGLDSDSSATASVAGLLLFAAGPSAGHAYAGRVGNPGLAVRAGAAVVGSIALGGMIGCALTGHDAGYHESHQDDDDGCSAWYAAFTVAGLAYLGGAVYEIGTAARAARAYNSRYGLDVQLAPTAVVAGDGSRAPGVALAGRF
jgi:hypothetical protein